ncbi:MAG: hypothetical protein ACYC6X_01940 [Minisyncoccota bacterium]
MPQKKSNSEPPQVMTWPKASLVLIFCLIFDAVRFMFSQFWFFGPAMTAIYCTSKVGGWIGSVSGLTATACTAGAVAAGTVGVVPIEVFGAVMAIAVGLLGWMVIGAMLMANARIFKANAGNALWFVVSLGVSEIPFIGALPALTVTVWRMYAAQIKKEKAELLKYEEAQAETQQQEREQEAAQIMQFRDAQLAQAEEQEAANEDDYIPDEVRKAA